MMRTLQRSTELLPLREAIDELFEQAFTAFPFWTSSRMPIRVPIDLYEANDRYVIRALVPGVKPEDVTVTCENGVVTIAGQVQPLAGDGLEPVIQEIGTGAFRREVRLPLEVDCGAAEATFEHGVLTLRLPKTAEARARTIPVKVAEPVHA